MPTETKIVPPAPRSRVHTPKVMDPAERARNDAARHALMQQAVPQPKPNDPADPGTMSATALLDGILATHRRMLSAMGRPELEDAYRKSRLVLADFQAAQDAAQAQADYDARKQAVAEAMVRAAQARPVGAKNPGPATLEDAMAFLDGMTPEEREARLGAAEPETRIALEQQAQALLDEWHENAAAQAAGNAAGTQAPANPATAAGEPESGTGVSDAADTDPNSADGQLNLALRAAGIDYDPGLPTEVRQRMLADSKPPADPDADNDGRNDTTGQFTDNTTSGGGASEYAQLREAIKKLGGTPKGNTDALRAQLAQLQGQ